jgi:spore coat polysaccharide biosynthesis protein SpsF
MKRKLIAAVACRNAGTRLYGKPLQNLDIEKKISVLDYIISWMKTISEIDEIVLGISEGAENQTFINFATEKSLKYIIGDEEDVLSRLIKCGESEMTTDVFRITSESPFTFFEVINSAWEKHQEGDYDLTRLDNVPDGSGFEIIKLDALRFSHLHGSSKHRSELCTLFIRENLSKFKIWDIVVPDEVKRTDIRLTIDYPEDLVFCRAIYSHFKDSAPKIPLTEIISFIDQHPDLKAIVDPFVDEGLKTMYL